MELPTMDANGWRHRAYAEVYSILGRVEPLGSGVVSPSDLVSLMVVAWLQGFNLGAHETLGEAEQAFQRLREDLTT